MAAAKPVHETDARLDRLRMLMISQGIDAYLITGYDPHLCEYVPDHWQRRQWISGFDGSFGHVLITQASAHLFTDSRYTIQATRQLNGTTFSFEDKFSWIAIVDKLDTGMILGLNLDCIPHSAMQVLRTQTAKKHIMIKSQTKNLVDRIWIGRPSMTPQNIVNQPVKYAGETSKKKLARLRKILATSGSDYLVIPGLDDIAWLFNLRGTDIKYNPVFFAYALIGTDDGWIYLHQRAIDDRTAATLPDSVQIRPYKDFMSDLKFLTKKKSRVNYDPNTCNADIGRVLKHQRHIKAPSPLPAMKSIKNAKESAGAKHAHLKDGRAITTFLHRFSQGEFANTSESRLAEKLSEIRQQQPAYKGDSFASIVGYQGNGAIVHYRAVSDHDKNIATSAKECGLLLIDSGGQYLEGTTDITRTLLVGKAEPEWINAYTRVLKGHIQLAMAIFPEGTRGSQLDVLARQALWKVGKNYGHGTGHGVGSYLCVHEGPIRISPRGGISNIDNPPLEPGHILSNEPGYYENGEFGIRLENLVLVRKHQTIKGYLCFETLTLCPFESNLIDRVLLTQQEAEWLDSYHQRVYRQLSAAPAKSTEPPLSNATKAWLKSIASLG